MSFESCTYPLRVRQRFVRRVVPPLYRVILTIVHDIWRHTICSFWKLRRTCFPKFFPRRISSGLDFSLIVPRFILRFFFLEPSFRILYSSCFVSLIILILFFLFRNFHYSDSSFYLSTNFVIRNQNFHNFLMFRLSSCQRQSGSFPVTKAIFLLSRANYRVIQSSFRKGGKRFDYRVYRGSHRPLMAPVVRLWLYKEHHAARLHCYVASTTSCMFQWKKKLEAKRITMISRSTPSCLFVLPTSPPHLSKTFSISSIYR